MESKSTNPRYQELVKDLPTFRAIYCPICGNGPKRVAVNHKYRCRCGVALSPSYTVIKTLTKKIVFRVTANENGSTITDRMPFVDNYTEDEQ